MNWSIIDTPFDEVGFEAMMGLLAHVTFEMVMLEVDDPEGWVLGVEPENYVDVAAGTPIPFELTVSGTLLEAPTTGAEELHMSVVTDDGFVLARRTLYHLP
jgi:hypothetical protein